MSPYEVINTTLAIYAAMESYQDRGVVLTEWPDNARETEVIFSTTFRRPNFFRFEWTTHHPYHELRHLKTHRVIWSDGVNAFLHNDQKGCVEAKDSLGMAIAGATGVSNGSAFTVANMLMPGLGAFSFPQLQKMALEEDSIDHTRCNRVRGYHPHGHCYDVYIDMKDRLLRQVSVTTPDHIMSREIRRDILVNAPIDEHAFRFHYNKSANPSVGDEPSASVSIVTSWDL